MVSPTCPKHLFLSHTIYTHAMYIQTTKYRNLRNVPCVSSRKSNHGFDFFTKKEQKPGSLYLFSQPSNHLVWKLVCIILMRTRKGERESAHYMEGRPESYAKSEKPWRCLCLGFTVHNINTRLRRFTTLQYSHIRRTAALTFIAC